MLFFTIIGVIIFVVVWTLCLIFNIRLAQDKNRNVVLWVILSVFLSWIALILNAVLPEDEY